MDAILGAKKSKTCLEEAREIGLEPSEALAIFTRQRCFAVGRLDIESWRSDVVWATGTPPRIRTDDQSEFDDEQHFILPEDLDDVNSHLLQAAERKTGYLRHFRTENALGQKSAFQMSGGYRVSAGKCELYGIVFEAFDSARRVAF